MIKVQVVLVEGFCPDRSRVDSSVRKKVQHPRQRDFVRPQGWPGGKREPLWRQIIPVSTGRDWLDETQRGPQQAADVIPAAARYAERRLRNVLQPVRQKPCVCRDVFRRSAERPPDRADRRAYLLALAFRQTDGLQGCEQIGKARGRHGLLL